MSETLYEADFLLWTREQAERLRARQQGANALDWENLAEEIEAVGRAERNASATLTQRILEHLYLLASSTRSHPRNHWTAEIDNFRDQLGRTLTPTIRREIEAELENLHHRAVRQAAVKIERREPEVPVNVEQRWSMAQVLGEEDDPAPMPDLV